SLDDIVTMTVYTTERRWGEIFTDMRKEVFKTGHPSSAFMEARKFKTPGALLEIQAIAVLKEWRAIGIQEGSIIGVMGESDENSHVVVADLSVGSCESVVRARF